MAFVNWRTWVAGAVVTAAQMNQDVRDNLNAWFPLASTSGVAWTTYTPTLTQSGAVTKTVTYAKYTQIGKTVIVNGFLTCTGSGTSNNVITVGLPVTAATGPVRPVGVGTIIASGTMIPGIAHLLTTTTVSFTDSTQTVVNWLGQTGSIYAAALASGNTVGYDLTYEAA